MKSFGQVSRTPLELVARGELFPDPMTLLTVVPGEAIDMSEVEVTRLSNIGMTDMPSQKGYWAQRIKEESGGRTNLNKRQLPLIDRYLWLPPSNIELFYARIAMSSKNPEDSEDAEHMLFEDFPADDFSRTCTASFSRSDGPRIMLHAYAGIMKETDDWLQRPGHRPLQNQIIDGAPTIQEVLRSSGGILGDRCRIPADSISSLIGMLTMFADYKVM